MQCNTEIRIIRIAYVDMCSASSMRKRAAEEQGEENMGSREEPVLGRSFD